MIKKLKMSLISLASLALLAAPALALTSTTYADNISDCVSQGTDLGGSSTGPFSSTTNCTPNNQQAKANTSSLNKIVKEIVNIFSIIVGIIAVIMIIVGGFKYITSGGESNKVSSAKNTLIFAIVGLIIVALAQFIVHFVLNKANDVTTSSSLVTSLIDKLPF